MLVRPPYAGGVHAAVAANGPYQARYAGRRIGSDEKR